MSRWIKVLFLGVISLGFLLGSSNVSASSWYDPWEKELESNFGNWDSIATWVNGVQLLDNNGNIFASITVNPQTNSATYTIIQGGAAVGGHEYTDGGGWRYNVVEYVRDGVKLVGIYSSIDGEHTRLTIWLGDGIQITVNIDEGNLTESEIVEIMDAIENGNYTWNKENEVYIITTSTNEQFEFTFGQVAFTAGWVREHLDNLEESIKVVLAEYGIDGGELDNEYDKDVDGDGDKDIYDALIDTFNNYKAPLSDETVSLLMGVEYNEVTYAINDADLAEFLDNICFTKNWETVRDNYIDYAKGLSKNDYVGDGNGNGKGFDWDGDGDIDGDDYEWLHDSSRTTDEINDRMRDIFDQLVFEPLYEALMTGEWDGNEFTVGKGEIEIDIDNDGDIDIEIKLVDEKDGNGNVGIRLRAADLADLEEGDYVKTQWMDSSGEWIKWRHMPEDLWNKIESAQTEYKEYKGEYEGVRVTSITIVGLSLQLKEFSTFTTSESNLPGKGTAGKKDGWNNLWGDPAVAGDLSYDPETGTVHLTVDIWRDVNGKLHINQDYWDSLSDEEKQEIINNEGGIDNIKFYNEELTIELDLSLLDEAIANSIIEAAKAGESTILFGLGPDELKPNDTLQVLGLGFGPFEEFPYDL